MQLGLDYNSLYNSTLTHGHKSIYFIVVQKRKKQSLVLTTSGLIRNRCDKHVQPAIHRTEIEYMVEASCKNYVKSNKQKAKALLYVHKHIYGTYI